MPKRTINMNLDFAKNSYGRAFDVKQFDSIVLDINTYLNGVQYDIGNAYCKLFVGVESETYLQDRDIQVFDNKIIIDVDENILSKVGAAYAEVELRDNDGVITSASFIFYIQERIGEGAFVPGVIEGFVERYERLLVESNDNINNILSKVQNDYNETKNDAIKSIDDKISEVDVRVSDVIAAGTVDLELKDARRSQDGTVHACLSDRLIGMESKPLELFETVEG